MSSDNCITICIDSDFVIFNFTIQIFTLFVYINLQFINMAHVRQSLAKKGFPSVSGV